MISSGILVATSERSAGDPAMGMGRGKAPSALTPVLGRPLVAHALCDLLDFGAERIVVLVDGESEAAIALALDKELQGPASIELMRRDPRLDLPAGIAAARLALGDVPFLLRFADCIGRNPLRLQIEPRELGDYDAIALMSRFREAGGRPEHNGSAEKLNGSAEKSPPMSEFHVGVFAFGVGFPSAFATPENGASNWIDSTLGWMERRGGNVERRHVDGWWRHRGERDSILAVNSFMLAGLQGEDVVATVVDSDIGGAVRCDPSARIEASVIRGPVTIGANAEIKDAFIGPFTSVGANVRIDGAEVENSVVLEGSTVSHIGGRLDSSVIGPHATISRDFRIPRGTRLDIGPGANVSIP
jgi:glucose-1-phosphate thymidylyltransferase